MSFRIQLTPTGRLELLLDEERTPLLSLDISYDGTTATPWVNQFRIRISKAKDTPSQQKQIELISRLQALGCDANWG